MFVISAKSGIESLIRKLDAEKAGLQAYRLSGRGEERVLRKYRARYEAPHEVCEGHTDLKTIAVSVGGKIQVIENAYPVFTAHRTVRGTQRDKPFIHGFQIFRRISKMFALKALWFVPRCCSL